MVQDIVHGHASIATTNLYLHHLGTAADRAGLERLNRRGHTGAHTALWSPNDTRQILQLSVSHLVRAVLRNGGANQTCGWEAVEARSRRPHRNSRAVTDALRERICTRRCELQAAGLDHGPVSIAARLQQEGLRPPALSTIRRILTAAGLITPQPKKRPKSSYRRFQADQPNECWQSDFKVSRDIVHIAWPSTMSRVEGTGHRLVGGTAAP